MTMKRNAAFAACLFAVASLTGAATTSAAEIKVMHSAAVKEILIDLAPAFEKASGHRLTLIAAGSEAVGKRVGGGEIVDIAIAASTNIDRLVADGKLVRRVDVAKSGIGVALRAGLQRPDISNGEAVKTAVLAARSVAYSSGPSGFYLADLFKKMGIAEQIKGKVTQTAPGVQVGEVVARGEADLGFQQVSELQHLKGIQYLGPLPADIQHTTMFSGGVHTTAPQKEAAEAFIRFVTAPGAGASIRKAGMEPG